MRQTSLWCVAYDVCRSANLIAENEVGLGVSGEPAQVTVHYRPKVTIRMEPATPVTETEHRSDGAFYN